MSFRLRTLGPGQSLAELLALELLAAAKAQSGGTAPVTPDPPPGETFYITVSGDTLTDVSDRITFQ